MLRQANSLLRQAIILRRGGYHWSEIFKFTFRSAAKKIPRYLTRLSRRSQDRLAINATVNRGVEQVSTLAVILTGGLGDYLIAGRFLRDLGCQIGPIKFEIFTPNPKIASWALAGVPGNLGSYYDVDLKGTEDRYSLVLFISNYLEIKHGDLSDLSIALQSFAHRVEDFIKPLTRYIDDAYLTRALVDDPLQFRGVQRWRAAHEIAGLSYGGDHLTLEVAPLTEQDGSSIVGPYITVSNGYDDNMLVVGTSATKCYPHFDAALRLIKLAYPELLVVQVGTRTSTPLLEADVSLIGRTNLAQAAGVIGGAIAHLDNEGGLVHLARCLGVRSSVVFGPTPELYFGYPGNENLRPLACGGCWWVTQTWMSRCPRNLDQPECVYSQPPELVAQSVMRLLEAAGLGPGKPGVV